MGSEMCIRDRDVGVRVAQDIGGAIKGAVRGDYFWGSGKDDVLDYAGRMNSAGRYFIMLPKKTETRN